MHLLNGQSLAVSYQPSHWTHSGSNSGSVRFKIIPKDSVWIQTHDHPHSEALTTTPQGLAPQGDTSLPNMAIAGKLEILVIPLHHESCRAPWCFYTSHSVTSQPQKKGTLFSCQAPGKLVITFFLDCYRLGPGPCPRLFPPVPAPPTLNPVPLNFWPDTPAVKGLGKKRKKEKHCY